MNRGKIRRRAQQGCHPASDYSSPWTETSLLNCHVTSPSPLVSEPYGSNALPIHQNYGIERPLVTGPVYSLSAESQGVGDYGLSLPPQPERRQCLQDWGFSMPGQFIGTIPGHERSSSLEANIPPIPYEFEGDTHVEDEEDHVEWSLTKEATEDTQGFPEQEIGTRYLACPFYKHDPKTFSKPKWKSCAHLGDENMHRLKDHLKRRHKATAELPQPEETIQESQFEQMRSWGRSSGRGRPAIEQWQHTYRVLFPNDMMIPSP